MQRCASPVSHTTCAETKNGRARAKNATTARWKECFGLGVQFCSYTGVIGLTSEGSYTDSAGFARGCVYVADG